jgi:hypothetical protein
VSEDTVFVSAVEHAPRSFPLVTPDTLEKGVEMKLGRHPLASRLAEEQRAASRYAGVVATTKSELARLAKQYGIEG